MDDLIPALRMLERILVVGFGGLSIYLGYKLFFHLPTNTDQKGKIELPGVKIVLSRVGPGIFFCAFGSIVLLQSLYEEIQVKRSYSADKEIAQTVSSTLEQEKEHAQGSTEYFAGAGALTNNAASDDVGPFSLRSSTVRMYVAQLNCMSNKLDPQKSQVKLQNSFEMAKFGIFKLGWDSDEHGDFRAFITDPLRHKLAPEFTASVPQC